MLYSPARGIEGMESTRESNDAIPILSPHSKRENELIMTETRIVIQRQDSLGFNRVPRHETIIQRVLTSLNNLMMGNSSLSSGEPNDTD